jgi:hypothetical protein
MILTKASIETVEDVSGVEADRCGSPAGVNEDFAVNHTVRVTLLFGTFVTV